MGRNVRPAGYHAPAPRVLPVPRGHIRVSFYTTKGAQGPIIDVVAGDTLLLTAAHGVDFVKENELLEIKQGPYPGPAEDKIWL